MVSLLIKLKGSSSFYSFDFLLGTSCLCSILGQKEPSTVSPDENQYAEQQSRDNQNVSIFHGECVKAEARAFATTMNISDVATKQKPLSWCRLRMKLASLVIRGIAVCSQTRFFNLRCPKK